MKYVVCAVLVGIGALALSHSVAAWPTEKSVEHRSYNLAASGDVAIQNASGDIRVIGWDQYRVDLTITKTAWSEDDLAQLRADVGSSPDSLDVRAVYPNDCSNCDISFVLRIPRGASVTADAASGDIAIDSISGLVRAEAASGTIRLKGTTGVAHLHASSGDIHIDGSSAPMDAVSLSGDIDATNLAGDIDLVASSGDISADFARFDAVRKIRIANSSGSITLDVPRGSGFMIEASTNSGEIQSNLRLPIHEGDSGAAVSAQVGDGKASAQLRCTSGDINIKMR
jgi:hypothetical protein